MLVIKLPVNHFLQKSISFYDVIFSICPMHVSRWIWVINIYEVINKLILEWNWLILMFLKRSLHFDYTDVKFIKIGWFVHELWFSKYLIFCYIFDRGQKRHKTLFKNNLFQIISFLKDQKFIFPHLCKFDDFYF